MPKFRVEVHEIVLYSTEVEASTEEEAKAEAMERLLQGEVCEVSVVSRDSHAYELVEGA